MVSVRVEPSRCTSSANVTLPNASTARLTIVYGPTSSASYGCHGSDDSPATFVPNRRNAQGTERRLLEAFGITFRCHAAPSSYPSSVALVALITCLTRSSSLVDNSSLPTNVHYFVGVAHVDDASMA